MIAFQHDECKYGRRKRETNVRRRTYYTHDNGGRPFKVVYKAPFVAVHKETTDGYDARPFFEFEAKRAWIGESPRNEMTEFSGGFGKKFRGNSLLFHISHTRYVFIGDNVFCFDSSAPIHTFVSPVGNSDVPYPYAIDSEQRHYLMIERVVLNHVPASHADDPYKYYYKSTTIKSLPHPIGAGKITKFTIGENECTLSYKPHPAKDYDRFSRWDDFGDGLILYFENGTSKRLTKLDYIDIMQYAGRMFQFVPLHARVLAQGR